MARRCELTGRGTTVGGRIARRGLPKKKGGVGLKTTGHARREFHVNLQKKRVYVPQLGGFVTVRLSTRALKSLTPANALAVLRAAGVRGLARSVAQSRKMRAPGAPAR